MRLFVAIAFPETVKDGLEAGIRALRKQGVRASWSQRENLHLTLEFLGELDSPKPVIAAMEQVQVAPFSLEVPPPGRGHFLAGHPTQRSADGTAKAAP